MFQIKNHYISLQTIRKGNENKQILFIIAQYLLIESNYDNMCYYSYDNISDHNFKCKNWILVQNSNMYCSTVTFLRLIIIKRCQKILGKFSRKVHSFEGDDLKTCIENNIKQFQFYFENNSILKFNSQQKLHFTTNKVSFIQCIDIYTKICKRKHEIHAVFGVSIKAAKKFHFFFLQLYKTVFQFN